MTITAYRIAKRAYAKTIWSGIGAREFGGRWNSKGVAVIYAAENRSLAAMQQLVHLIRPRVLRAYVIASITFDDSQVTRVDAARLPRGWDAAVAPPALRKYGDEWVAAGNPPVLAVPSAVMRGEWNYLINPAHPAFAGLAKSRPAPFAYDARLA
jgi:RES domain-containing protein